MKEIKSIGRNIYYQVCRNLRFPASWLIAAFAYFYAFAKLRISYLGVVPDCNCFVGTSVFTLASSTLNIVHKNNNYNSLNQIL